MSSKLNHNEWKEYQLKEIATINPKTGEIPKKFCYIDLESVQSGLLMSKKIIHSDEAPSRAQRVLKPNDILYQTVRPYQKNNLFFEFTDMDYVASTGYAQIRTNKLCTPEFLYYLLHTEKFVNNVLARCTGTSYPAINSNDLKKIKVKVPEIPIQMKIENILISIDKKIELLEKKKEISNQTKSSILKSIFDNVSIYSEDVKINNLFSIKKGKGLSKEKIDVNGKYAAILYGELYTKYSEIIESPISFTDYDEGVPSKKGDILIPGSTTTKGIDLVTASVVCEDNIQLGGDINILRKKKELNPIYAATFIKYFMKREILRLTQGSTIIHLYGKDLKDLEIMLPSLKIQNNVANFIKHYNTKENLYNEEINKVKRFKKALLQKMFI